MHEPFKLAARNVPPGYILLGEYARKYRLPIGWLGSLANVGKIPTIRIGQWRAIKEDHPRKELRARRKIVDELNKKKAAAKRAKARNKTPNARASFRLTPML